MAVGPSEELGLAKYVFFELMIIYCYFSISIMFFCILSYWLSTTVFMFSIAEVISPRPGRGRFLADFWVNSTKYLKGLPHWRMLAELEQVDWGKYVLQSVDRLLLAMGWFLLKVGPNHFILRVLNFINKNYRFY